MEKNSSRKSKLIYIDERGSQSSCSATDEYIAREIQKIELVFKVEEDELAKQRARRNGNNLGWSDGYVSSCDEIDTVRRCSDTEFSDHDSELLANFDSLVRKTTSPFLFRNEKMEPLSFVLLLNDTIAERRLAKLIQRGGGQVYPKVRQMDDYSIVVVKDQLLTSHVGPVFRLEYLLRCISRNKIVSVNPYLRTFDNAPPLHKYDYMKIVYFKQVGWSELPQHILLNKPHNKVKFEKRSTIPRPPPTPPPTTQDISDDDEVIPQTPSKKVIVPSQKKFRRLQNLNVDDNDDEDDDDEVVPQIPPKEVIVPSQKKFRHLQNLNVDDDDDDDDEVVSQIPPKKDIVPSQKKFRRLQNLNVDDDDIEVVSQIPPKKDIVQSQKKFRRLKMSESSSDDDVISQTPSKKDPVPSQKKFRRLQNLNVDDNDDDDDDEVVPQIPPKKDIVPSQKKFRHLQNLNVDDDDDDDDDVEEVVSQIPPKKDIVPSQKKFRRLQNLNVDDDDEVVSQIPPKKDIVQSQKKFRRLEISESSSDDDVISQTPSKKDPVSPSHKKFSHFKVWAGNDVSSSEDSDFERDSKVQNVPEMKKVKRSTVNKHTRMMYSDAEDCSIVKYIADNDGYNSVKGTLLWRDMEKVNICPKRTWQSMKEHFLKKVMYNTNSYKFLTDGQKRKFQKLLLK
ncbi:uncharacterized protein LOC111045889 [Nilaparvata lugens]|uniref:uncharacterized protein LOC111045889 n=1 Tax=Nilaparvata lugens TaxID=108931 RepID=UPI00193E0806|nr:uncharacterized protein LOC111045889 [Nilaparvata lugens]